MNKREKVMKRLQEHYDYLVEQGHEVIFVAHQGSYNYDLDYENSDIDSKAAVVPSFFDFVCNKKIFSFTYILDNEEHIDTKDIRIMCDMWKKENISYIELLYTDYIIINPEYEDIMKALIKYRDKIVEINRNQFLRCIAGMSGEKVKALCHPYPNLIDKIEKYGFDGKQLSHCVRLNEFISRYVNGVPVSECYKSLQPELIINLKKNLNPKGTDYLSKEDAIKMINDVDFETHKLYKDNVSETDLINHFGISLLDETKYEILRKKFKKDL